MLNIPRVMCGTTWANGKNTAQNCAGDGIIDIECPGIGDCHDGCECDDNCPQCEGQGNITVEGDDPLEIKWTHSEAGSGLYLTTITLVTSTWWCPHIEIELNASGGAYAKGYWGGCTPAVAYISGGCWPGDVRLLSRS